LFLFLSLDKSSALKEVGSVLESGGVVALPSDTVYGIVTLLKFSPKLFYVKKRLPTKPVGLFISSPDVIKRYAELTINESLLNKLLPGRVTLLFKRIPNMTDNLHLNNDLVGFRIPDNEFIQKLCQQFDEPLAQTSANLSGEPSAIKPTV
jgi:tRNA threonylcarbamoyl adenosine modification protein (Sua5/YciO/YrdC/YwlC family)